MSRPWRSVCRTCQGTIVSADGTLTEICPYCKAKLMLNESGCGENGTHAERDAYYLYNMVDFNRNGKLDPKELQTALNYGGLQFSLPTVNILLSKHDRNRNGQIDFSEFKSLLDEVWRWKDAFDFFDTDKSGSIDFQELQQALSRIGIDLSPTTFQTVFFSSDTDRSGSISMDEFIKLVTELQLSQIKYTSLNRDKDGKIELSYDSFVDLIFSIRS